MQKFLHYGTRIQQNPPFPKTKHPIKCVPWRQKEIKTSQDIVKCSQIIMTVRTVYTYTLGGTLCVTSGMVSASMKTLDSCSTVMGAWSVQIHLGVHGS